MASTNAHKKDDFTPAPPNAKIDDKVAKKLAGEAVAKISGVLDVKGGFADILKDSDDPTRGISVTITDDQQATVNVKLITETGKNIPDIVNKATAAITKALQDTAGLKVQDVCVEVTDTMTREDYEAQNEAIPIYPAGFTPM